MRRAPSRPTASTHALGSDAAARKPDAARGPRSTLALVLILGGAASLLLVVAARMLPSLRPSERLPEIRRMRLERGLADELKALAVATEPVVLTNVPNLPPWGPEEVSGVRLTRVYSQQSSPSFGPYFDASRPLARVGAVRPRHNYTEETMSGADFFGRAAPPYVYYSGEVERDLTPGFFADLRPLERALVALRPSHSSVNLWLGRAGGVAPCHYDGYHNAMAMLHGAKRFVVAPPTASRLLRPFPFLHPSHAQCQTDVAAMLSPGADAHGGGAGGGGGSGGGGGGGGSGGGGGGGGSGGGGSGGGGVAALAAAGALETELRAGEVLYLPPLWFHEVGAASEAAVSVNGWSGSAEAEAAEQLFRLHRPKHAYGSGDVDYTTPFEESGDAAAMMRATEAAALVARLSARTAALASEGSPRQWLLAAVWRERYAPLVASAELPAPKLAAPLDCGAVQPMPDAREPREVRVWVGGVEEIARKQLPRASRHLWLGNLAEVVVAEHVGAKSAASFWRAVAECLGPRLT